MNDFIGLNIENYKIVSLLGKGGMGIVYKAYDTKLDRFVAIKMLNPQNHDNDRFIERFKREAKNQAKLTHPNIATVYGFIEYEGLLGIVMEYLDGEGLDKIIYRKKRIGLIDTVTIIKQVLQGLGYAHQKGFVHRDIKPSNIILGRDGTVKIMDFGISKSLQDKGMTKTGAKVGTLYYMSPEQVKGGDLTIQSDIYSVGCTLFEMLVGEPPFYNQTDFEVMEGHLKREPAKISKLIIGLPEDLDKIIYTAMKKNPEERFISCDDFFQALEQLKKYYNTLSPKIRQNNNQTKIRIYSTVGFSAFVVIIIALSYFIYSQVYELIESKKIFELRKYGIESLFEKKFANNFKVSKLDIPTKNNLNSVYFLNNNAGIVVGDSGTCLVTNNSGKNWTKKSIDSSITFNDVFITEDGKSFLITNNGRIIKSTDYFDTYQVYPTDFNCGLLKIKFINRLIGFALGSKGTLLHTNNGGETWNQLKTGTNELLYDIDFVSENIGFIVGWNGILLKTNNGGINWNLEKPFSNKYIKSIAFDNNGNGFAVGAAGVIYYTNDEGSSWNEYLTNNIGSFQKIKFLDQKRVLGVGNKGTLIYTDNLGDNWKLVDSGYFINFSNYCITPNKNIYITGINGSLLKIN